MSNFIYTASDISRFTNGHVSLKTLNNWAAQGSWFSPLAEVTPPHPRRFSRFNVIEAVLASRMMMAGIKRNTTKELLTAIATGRQLAPTYPEMDRLPVGLEQLPVFRPGSDGWCWAMSWRVENGAPFLDDFAETKVDDIANWLGSVSGYAIVIPVSAIVAAIDASTPAKAG